MEEELRDLRRQLMSLSSKLEVECARMSDAEAETEAVILSDEKLKSSEKDGAAKVCNRVCTSLYGARGNDV